MYVKGKMVDMGFWTIQGFSHPLGILEHNPLDKWGTTELPCPLACSSLIS